MLLSSAFLIISAISIFLGFHALYVNPKAEQNRIFFILTLSFAVWSAGFSFAVSAPSLDACLFWRKFAAIGWGTFFSLLLHFLLVLTGHDVKKWRTYALLYAPAAVTLLGFTYFNLNPQPFNMVQTSLGWANVAENNAWDWFYACYYLAFTGIGLTLVRRWGKRTPHALSKKQARIILISFAVTVAAGSLTDIFGNALFSMRIPQVAPLYMTLPIIAIFLNMRKNGMLGVKAEAETFVTEKIRKKLATSFFIASVAGAAVNIVTQYFSNSEHEELGAILLYSLVLLAFGFSFLVTHHLKIDVSKKNIIYAVLLALLIPVMTFKYAEYGGITIWAASFICLIVVLLLNSRFMIGAIVTSFLLTQALLWAFYPNAPAEVNNVAYLSRIGIFLIGAWLSFYVNRVFAARNDENRQQINIQRLIADISSDFVSVGESNFAVKADNTLGRIGRFFRFDHAYLFMLDASQSLLDVVYQWNAVETGSRASVNTLLNGFSFVTERILVNEPLVIPDADNLAEDDRQQLELLLGQRVSAFIAVPVITMGSVQGFLAAAYSSAGNAWSDNHINTIRIISNILADADAKVRQEQEINRMAFYDYLTGLPNRLLFKDRATQAIELAKRTGNALAVMFFDLDAFKAVNDTMGHQGGDSLLIKISEALTQVIRRTDTVSRFSGDEFLILINHMSAVKDTLLVINKIMDIFTKAFSINGQEYYISASAGIAIYPEDGEDADTLIKNADIAMYKAKEKGKNRYELCSPDMKEEALIKMQLTNSLYRALDRDELFLHYQPQIDIATKAITGVEALLRWRHPTMGLISPCRFIPLAEQTGLIGPIGEWVLKTACMQNKAWQDMGLPPIRMAVNISGNQFRNPGLVNQIHHILAVAGLEAQYLDLEITESVTNDESDYILKVLNDLKALGVCISIDDFGTEYSSLNRLKTLPIDKIKLDILFVRGICNSKKDRAIAEVIIKLAQNLDLKVIAEGVENEEQLEFLTRRRCDEVQGYYYYRPVSGAEIETILKGGEAC